MRLFTPIYTCQSCTHLVPLVFTYHTPAGKRNVCTSCHTARQRDRRTQAHLVDIDRRIASYDRRDITRANDANIVLRDATAKMQLSLYALAVSMLAAIAYIVG